MSPQGDPTPDEPLYAYRPQSPVEIENRLTTLETTVANLPTGIDQHVAGIDKRVVATETTIANFKWWFMALIGLATVVGVLIGTLTRALAFLTSL